MPRNDSSCKLGGKSEVSLAVNIVHFSLHFLVNARVRVNINI
jgi:hypothetical protein